PSHRRCFLFHLPPLSFGSSPCCAEGEASVRLLRSEIKQVLRPYTKHPGKGGKRSEARPGQTALDIADRLAGHADLLRQPFLGQAFRLPEFLQAFSELHFQGIHIRAPSVKSV